MHKGNEYELDYDKKESRKNNMEKSNKLMDIHHEISMKIHEVLIKQLDDDSSVREYTNMILLDYRIQLILNDMLGIKPFDNFLIDCTMSEFYKKKWNTYPLNKISYPNFCKEVLETMKETVINHNVIDGIDEKIKRLSR